MTLVRERINEQVTTIMTDISAEVKRQFLHSSVIKLAGVLGPSNLGDTVLKHMITYLNCKQDWQLRAQFYAVLPDVVHAIGLQVILKHCVLFKLFLQLKTFFRVTWQMFWEP